MEKNNASCSAFQKGSKNQGGRCAQYILLGGHVELKQTSKGVLSGDFSDGSLP